MLVFRVIYYWVPLVIAAALLGLQQICDTDNGTTKP